MFLLAYATDSGIQVGAETLSLLLIAASFVLIILLNARLRKVRTFQFEILIFSVVLSAAEIPRTLYSLGIVDLDSLSTTGLAIHSASMAVLTLFVAYRVLGFLRGIPPTSIKGAFEELVTGAVSSAISSTFGESTGRAVSFYVDSSIAITDPEGYERALGKIFGSGSSVLVGSILDRICSGSGVERSSVDTLSKGWAMAKERLGS